MGVHIHDLTDGNVFLRANWWRWRTTAELIRRLEYFSDDRFDLLSDGLGELTVDEARLAADHLKTHVLARLSQGERIRLDGVITDIPDDGTFYRKPEEQHLNYSVDREWLADFVEFCNHCHGFYVTPY